MRHSMTSLLLIIVLCSFMISCSKIPNSPYPMEDLNKDYIYSSYNSVPKTLDPAVSYSSNEAAIIGAMYEPPFMYHPLKRPYILVPNSVREMPRPEYSKEMIAYAAANSVNLMEIVTKEQKDQLNSLKPLFVEFFNNQISSDKIEKADEKVVSKRLEILRNDSLNKISELGYKSKYTFKLVDYIFENARNLVDSIVKERTELTQSQFESKINAIYNKLNTIKAFKTNISKASLLSKVTESAKEYWTYNDWNPNEIISVTGDIVSNNTVEKLINTKSVETKKLNDNDVQIITFDSAITYPEGSEILGVTTNFELVTLAELTTEEKNLLELTDANTKYFKVANTSPMSQDLVAKLVGTKANENKTDLPKSFQLMNNQVFAVNPKHFRIDFDIINGNESVFSTAHFGDLNEIGDAKDLILSFKFWVPSSEDEAREIHQDVSKYANAPNLRTFKVLNQLKKNPEMPFFVNSGKVHAIYTMRVMPGIYYQPHPCFSKDKKTNQYLFHEGKKSFIKSITQDDGKVTYFINQNGKKIEIKKELMESLIGKPIDPENLSNVFDLDDFEKYFPEYDPNTSTRELTAADYVYQLKRLHNPQAPAQILPSLLFPYVENTYPYYRYLRDTIINERKQRRAEKGIAYSQEVDEEENPIKLDYEMQNFDGARVLDKYTYQIVLTQPYPQFKYWMAMPFFSPMPWEADMFFLQGPMQKNTLTLSKFPVATGAYRMWKYQRQFEISSIQNENFNRLGPDNGKKPPVYIEMSHGSNKLMASMPLGVSENDKTPGYGVDKNKNGVFDGSKDVRDYLKKNDFAELPFFDENGNGVYDGFRYWDEEERFAHINYAENYIDFNGNDIFDENDRKVNFAEGVYFEDLDLNGIFNPEIKELWYRFPATYRTVYPYAGEKNVCPDEHIQDLLKLQREARKLWIDKEKNKQQLRDLDEKCLKEMVRIIEEYNYTQSQIGDEAAGTIRDAGRRLPFIKAIIRRKEKEPTSIWSKFIQGYYEISGIAEDKFDKFIDMSVSGAYLSEELKAKGIQLRSNVLTSIWYMAFNMQNQTWGWADNYDDEQPDLKKAYLRQAVAIALNFEEYNDTFSNGRNVACHMILPPGIYGYESPEDQTFFENIDDLEYYFSEEITLDESDKRTAITEMTSDEINDWGEKYSILFKKFSSLNKFEQQKALKQKYERNKAEYLKNGVKPGDVKIDKDAMMAEVHFGLNWVSYTWNEKTKSAERRSIAYAKKLLDKAGYPGGKDNSGNQLTLKFLTMGTSPADLDVAKWRERKLKNIGVSFKSSGLEYSKFQEIAKSGGYDSLEWGWNADYPDPENFFFLLQGKSAKCASNSLKKMTPGGGENAANYWSEDFDKLFKQMSTMSDTPERLKIIRKMTQLLRRDMPWIYNNLAVSYVLYHKWYKNSKTNLMGNNSHWFRRIDPDVRAEYRISKNQPKWLPVIIFFMLVILVLVPGIVSKARKEKNKTGKIK